MAKILVVEDDDLTAQMLMDWMDAERHVGELVRNGLDAKDRLRFYKFDLIILDWQLPGMDGIEVLSTYRGAGGQAMVLMLTGKTQVEDKESGFGTGADDYLTKPFHIRELTARVNALLSRPREIPVETARLADVYLDKNKCQLVVSGHEIKLLPKEFELVAVLLSAADKDYVSPERILSLVWQDESEAALTALRTSIRRLRTKFEALALLEIESIRGKGYRLVRSKMK